jgi:hypothetical protein
LKEDYVPDSDTTLTEEKALSLAWEYMRAFGIASDTVRHEPEKGATEGYFRLEFSSTESKNGQIVAGQVTIYLASDGELTSISDARIWCKYIRDVQCISPYDSVSIAPDVGVGDWNGTAYVSSVEADYEFIDETGYLIPVWRINADFTAESGDEYDWSPVIDAVK